MLNDLRMLLLLVLSVGDRRLFVSVPPFLSRVGCWLFLQFVFSVSPWCVWFPAVTSGFQPIPHVLHPSDTVPAWLSSRESSLLFEWQRMRDLDNVKKQNRKKPKTISVFKEIHPQKNNTEQNYMTVICFLPKQLLKIIISGRIFSPLKYIYKIDR